MTYLYLIIGFMEPVLSCNITKAKDLVPIWLKIVWSYALHPLVRPPPATPRHSNVNVFGTILSLKRPLFSFGCGTLLHILSIQLYLKVLLLSNIATFDRMRMHIGRGYTHAHTSPRRMTVMSWPFQTKPPQQCWGASWQTMLRKCFCHPQAFILQDHLGSLLSNKPH